MANQRMPLDDLSQAAHIAFTTLTYCLTCGTPDEIADGPYGVDQVDAGDIECGLEELESIGAATLDSDGRWIRIIQSWEFTEKDPNGMRFMPNQRI